MNELADELRPPGNSIGDCVLSLSFFEEHLAHGGLCIRGGLTGGNFIFVVIMFVLWWRPVEVGVEVRRVDSQGRLILPVDWRESEVGDGRELYVVKRKGYLKIIPKRRVNLTENFDRVDLGVEAIESWKEFERRVYEVGV